MEKRSYNVSDFSIDMKKEIERLGHQVDLFWETEKKIYQELSFGKKSLSILDCGAGPGFYSLKLRTLFPEASITSLEYDKNYADYFSRIIDHENIPDVTVINGSLYDGVLTGKFDIITSRLVFEHLHDPQLALEKICGHLNEGGALVLIDNDFENHLKTFPRIGELGELYRAYCNLRVQEGGDPYIGRRLPQLLKAAGLKKLKMDSLVVHSTFEGDKQFYLSESSAIGVTLVQKGFLEPEVFERLSVKWSEYVRTGQLGFMRELYYCVGFNTSEVDPEECLDEATETIRETSMIIDDNLAPREQIMAFLKGSKNNFSFDEKAFDTLSAFDIGLDSISIMEFIEWLEKKYHRNFTFLELLEADSLYRAVMCSIEDVSDCSTGGEYGEV